MELDTMTEPITTAQLVERLEATGKWWMIGKGQTRKSEPLYGCVIQEPQIDGRVLAKTESDDLAECVSRALQRMR